MQYKLLEILRCPGTKSKLSLQVIKEKEQSFGNVVFTTIEEGILFSDKEWFYPIINGIPRLCVEAFIDYKEFLSDHLPDYKKKLKYWKKVIPIL